MTWFSLEFEGIGLAEAIPAFVPDPSVGMLVKFGCSILQLIDLCHGMCPTNLYRSVHTTDHTFWGRVSICARSQHMCVVSPT